jgi:hypothetical protein
LRIGTVRLTAGVVFAARYGLTTHCEIGGADWFGFELPGCFSGLSLLMASCAPVLVTDAFWVRLVLAVLAF